MQIGPQAPLESLLGSEGLGRMGAMVAVDSDGVLQGVVTLAEVRRALQPRHLTGRKYPDVGAPAGAGRGSPRAPE